MNPALPSYPLGLRWLQSSPLGSATNPRRRPPAHPPAPHQPLTAINRSPINCSTNRQPPTSVSLRRLKEKSHNPALSYGCFYAELACGPVVAAPAQRTSISDESPDRDSRRPFPGPPDFPSSIPQCVAHDPEGRIRDRQSVSETRGRTWPRSLAQNGIEFTRTLGRFPCGFQA